MHRIICLLLFISFFSTQNGFSQVQVGGEELPFDYSQPKDYIIGGITVTGVKYLDESVLRTLSGLSKGDKIRVPGDKITRAIENLWKQGLLADIKIVATRIEGDKIFLELRLQERPRLSKFSFDGITKSEADKIRERIKLVSGKIITDNLIQTTENEIESYFIDKGYLHAKATVITEDEKNVANSQFMKIQIKKGPRVKIHSITLEGVQALNETRLKRSLKDTKEHKWYRIFSTSKFVEDNYTEDKQKLLAKYTQKGYRDANITWDTVYDHNEASVDIKIRINEGPQYFFRNITWIGNTKYAARDLDKILNIHKGEIFNQKKLDEGLFGNASGRDITSLYMDNGYLFFSVTPVEVQVVGDSIDYEMRIYEGKQAIVNKITVVGNTKTNDKVIMREIRTKPGQLFSRNEIIRTQRELAQLGYFDPEKLGVNPKPNAQDGTVDIEYVVEEKPSDQLELSGGWGGNSLVGTLGVSFNNFSASNIFKKGAWAPLPSGDGQRLSLRMQTNGKYYQSYNASFTEPYLGGKKPNSFSYSIYHSVQSNGRPRHSELRQAISIIGTSVGLGQRLKKPDDFFSVYHEFNFQYYKLDNYGSSFLFSDGFSYNIFFQETLSRNSVDQPIYPRTGSQFSTTLQLTPPWSWFNSKNYAVLPDQEKYKYIEYHKWKFSALWYTPLAFNKLVLMARANYGFLGYYNKDIGPPPFERFYLGGDGLSGFSLDGREIIAQRGYPNNSLSPPGGGTIYDKYTVEVRYPLSLNPSATIYMLGFLEAGNAFNRFRDYNPFDLKRGAGGGVRIFLPMFGMLGLDWGYGFDNVPGTLNRSGGNFHFLIGQQF
ncbi:MAG TPA: outer membrane protein assembly factor BamA [Bacteroidia bacterium]|nr:outer membrane protein assembly factor BamA [Bacteroidia bacterium]